MSLASSGRLRALQADIPPPTPGRGAESRLEREREAAPLRSGAGSPGSTPGGAAERGSALPSARSSNDGHCEYVSAVPVQMLASWQQPDPGAAVTSAGCSAGGSGSRLLCLFASFRLFSSTSPNFHLSACTLKAGV